MKEDAIAFQIKGHTYLLVQTGINSITLREKFALSFQTIIRYRFRYHVQRKSVRTLIIILSPQGIYLSRGCLKSETI